MVQTPVKRENTTIEDFLLLPETKPASEYIDGKIIQKPMPKAAHSRIRAKLTSAIDLALESTQKALTFPELRCTFGGHSIVPDITVLPWAAIPRDEDGMIDGELSAAPSWMIEILSPKQSPSKLVKKILHAAEYGTQMGWLVDPYEKCVFSYLPDAPTAFYEKSGVRLPVPEFASDFELTVGELFGWLYATDQSAIA
ncbi:Uma2 family endonuclease [cf. Phormidesmis sp. LEGE 11477]|uniref:Uma2 family endonuclease n=1 Tax=cf. Phormidesmis sp. LEGE 11477 TaxID=1828680 RepID=UPI001880582E|nr:Uma2 family endonuclease [cf. Phormidesmis sp. LEGE 11477]MBE9064215.1 Uma2 family endonuclease [cf. Phormidesmis sp. LEGE 11477]